MTHTSFMPHGWCMLWNTWLILLHVVSQGVLGVCYGLGGTLVLRLLFRRADLFIKMGTELLILSLFGILCGLSHIISILTIWVPEYWIQGLISMAMAATAVGVVL